MGSFLFMGVFEELRHSRLRGSDGTKSRLESQIAMLGEFEYRPTGYFPVVPVRVGEVTADPKGVLWRFCNVCASFGSTGEDAYDLLLAAHVVGDGEAAKGIRSGQP